MRRNGKSGRFRTVLYKYFSVILAICSGLLSVSTLASYRLLERIVIRQVYEKSVEQLEQVRSVFDAVHFSVIPAAVQLSGDRLVHSLMYSSTLRTAEILQALGRLDTAKLSNPLVDSIVVYNFLREQFYSTENGISSREEFADRQLVTMLDNARQWGLYRYIPRQVDGESLFTLLLGSPPIDGSRLKGAMVTNISERALRDLFSASATSLRGDLVIYDRDGVVLSHPDHTRFSHDESAEPHIAPLMATSQVRGTFVARRNGLKCLVTYVRNPDFGWSFVTFAPYDDLFAELRRSRNWVLSVLAALFVASVVAAFIASRRLYRPIGSMQQFAERLESDVLSDDARTTVADELEYVDAVLHRVYLQAQSLRSSVRNHRTTSFREATRTVILSGTTAHLQAIAEPNGEVGHDQPCRVVVARLDASAELHRRNDYAQTIASLYAFADAVTIGTGAVYPGVEIEPDHVAVLLTGSHLPLDDTEEMARSLQQFTRWITDVGELGFTIGIGTTVESLEDAPLSYRSALAATTQRFQLGPGRVIASVVESSQTGYRFPDDQTERLVRAVRAGEERQALRHLTGILDATREHRYEDFLLATHILIHRLETASVGTDSRNGSLPAVLHVRSRLGHFETIEEAARCFREVVRELCEAANAGSHRKREELARSIRELIDTHLTDPNLGSKWLADRLSISASYARSVFRDLMGISISDYVNECRLDRCKARLGNGEVQVKELYREVGFGSYNYFFTLFRRHTGMTPLQYKRRRGAQRDS